MLLGPSLPRRASEPQPPSPDLPTQVDRAAKHAHPRTLAGQPRIPKDEVSIWDPQQVPVKQSRRSRPPMRAAPCRGAGDSPREKGGGKESGIYCFQPSLWHRRTQSPCGSAGWEGQGASRPGHISGAGGPMASAGGPARQGLTAWACVRLRARPPSGGCHRPARGPSLPPPRARVRICRCARRAPAPPQLPQLTVSPPSSSPLPILLGTHTH